MHGAFIYGFIAVWPRATENGDQISSPNQSMWRGKRLICICRRNLINEIKKLLYAELKLFTLSLLESAENAFSSESVHTA